MSAPTYVRPGGHQPLDPPLDGRFVRAWVHLITGRLAAGAVTAAVDVEANGAPAAVRALAEAVARHGPHTLALGDLTLEAPSTEAIARARGGTWLHLGVDAKRRKYELDLATGSVSPVPLRAHEPSYKDLEALLRERFASTRDAAELAEALAAVDRHDAYFAPHVFESSRTAAREAAAAGKIGFLPVREVPAAPAPHEVPAGVDPARGVPSPDGRALLVTHPLRTRRYDLSTGAAEILLEGWWQLAGAWLADDLVCVLAAGGAHVVDRKDPEAATLEALKSIGGRKRKVTVTSSPLLHVLGVDGTLRYNIAVDADRVASTLDGRVVVLTRAPRRAPGWRTVILGLTARGLGVLAKHDADIGALRVDGDRVFGAHGFELLGVREALAACASWRVKSIRDELALESPPPPLEALEVQRQQGDALRLERRAGVTPRSIDHAPERAVAPATFPGAGEVDRERLRFSPDGRRAAVAAGGEVWDVDVATGEAERVWSSWPQILDVRRTADACWILARIHEARAELMRFERAAGGWRRAAGVMVEGFDRVYAAAGGRLLALTLNNPPPELAWTVIIGVDGDGALRHLGRVHEAVTGAWDDGAACFVEVDGETYEVRGHAAATAAAAAAEPRALVGIVFEPPGLYGEREFLPRHGGPFGYVDREGRLVIDHLYTDVFDFEHGQVRVADGALYCYGLIDRDGALALAHHYSWIDDDSEGHRAIARGAPRLAGRRPTDATWGLIGPGGALLLPPIAAAVREMCEGRAAVQREGGWNLLDAAGAWLLPDDARDCGDFQDGLCAVAPERLWGFLDREGRWVIEPRFSSAGRFGGGLAPVRLPDERAMRFVDAAGRVTDVAFTRFDWPHEGLARVEIDKKWGFVDAAGELVIAPRFEAAGNFYGGLATVCLGRRWGWIDRAGHLVIEPRFDAAFDFSDGIGRFGMGARQGFVNAAGEVIARDFEQAEDCSGGLAPVRQRGSWGFMDPTGAVVVAPRYAEVQLVSEGLAAVHDAGQWGFIDPTGAVVIEPRFDRVGRFRDGRAWVERR